MQTSTASRQRRDRQLLVALLKRLHFTVGLFVGPFLLIAALSGIAYALTPQLESWLYHDALTSDSRGTPATLARQIEAAQDAAGITANPAAVRPASGPGATTRVMFSAPGNGPSEHRALFIDPVTLAIHGDMTVYGTSGALPLRTAIDQFHRGLLLGDVGRLYSELAASWLWLIALGGALLWWQRRRATRASASNQPLRRRHATLGMAALAGLLFFSATGLTWSQYAGGNIAELRHAWGWGTPSVSTALGATPAVPSQDAHAAHHAAEPAAADQTFHLAPAAFDRAYDAARAAGIDAAKIEMVPPTTAHQAWKIREIGREWPTQVDQVALDPVSFAVTDRADFATFPLAAKLTRWGIDLHMGVLFGVANQVVLIAFAGSLATLICWGYLMWWRRRPAAPARSAFQPQTLTSIYRSLSGRTRLTLLIVAVALGVALPVMGASLVVFVAVDWLRWRAGGNARTAQTA
ncbi:PepSY-associated TM helix domain-containing protein [Salinicola rhizosphaerae]|uniref:Membrane protein n=1 Tax=Salinicola rhizosphaerae TaxID=1443141 RepID=A0ABQ3DW21_9GAMM|nr:PepSY-associated TM helix domain-containing protein [Salinicola rhizosphaerae]GHB09974.1 membrane protein [Salinicola rhizosphaerae]